MPDVVTIGTATIDAFVDCPNLNTKEISGRSYLSAMEKNDVEDIDFYTGGGATNSAATFRNLGLNVKTICAIGDDYNGRVIKRDLIDRGIKTSLVQVLAHEKSNYSVILKGANKVRSIFVYRGAGRNLSHRDINWKSLQGDLIYITSLGGNMRLLSKTMGVAEERGMKIAWNPGMKEINNGLLELKEFLLKTDYLLLNSQEAETLSGGSLLAEIKMLKKIQSYTKGLLLITYGAKGAKIFDHDKLLYRKATGSKVVDATGAGDAFGSGFTGMILKTDGDIEKSLDFALRNSGSVITELGAKNGLITS